MSALHPNRTDYVEPGLQPVRYDLDEFRLFIAVLDKELADLETQFAPRRPCPTSRDSGPSLGRHNLPDTEPHGNSEPAAS